MTVAVWRLDVARLLAEARDRFERERVAGLKFNYAQGYAEGPQRALTVGPDGLEAAIAEVTEVAEDQKSRLPETASPRRYTTGELDALRRAYDLFVNNGVAGARE